MRQLVQLGRVALAGVAFLSFGVGGVLYACALLPVVGWRHRRATPTERAAACQRWVGRSFALLHDFMRVCGLLHFEPRAAAIAVPGPRFVIVANHPTLVDVAALCSVFARIVVITGIIRFRRNSVQR